MEDRRIDWDDECVFDENGKVVSFKRESIANSFSKIPVPRDKRTIQDAEKTNILLKDILKPASREEVAVCIKKLSLHYGLQQRSPEEFKYLFNDYCDDLCKYSMPLIEEACRKIRINPDIKFLPSSGQIINLIEPNIIKINKLKKRIMMILGKKDLEDVIEKQGFIGLDSILNSAF